MTVEEIGNMIRVMRMTRGWSQYELAKKACISQSSIAMYEKGRRRPTEEQAEALADAFNVPKWSIYYGEDEVVPAKDAHLGAKTVQGRVISAGIDRMPLEKRIRAQEILELAFGKEYFREDDEQ